MKLKSFLSFPQVLYIGKIKVSHKKVPDSFIDDALDKFHKFEQEKREKEALLNNNVSPPKPLVN
jgi:TBC1 domain-containing protein 4